MSSVFMYTILLSTIIFCYFRLRFLVWFFQQDEYETRTFLKTIFYKLRLLDKKLVLGIILVGFIGIYQSYLSLILLILFVYFILKERKVLKGAKRKLAVTNRVKRLLSVSIIITSLLLYILSLKFASEFIFFVSLIIFLLPLILLISNILLFPLEAYYRRGFIKEAKGKLKETKARIIGITGSYGKTSTKHILAHILSSGVPVLFTPGSVNTLMGVCKIINRDLRGDHKFFIVEMGAYYKGSIRKLCDLVHPRDGIITAIGFAHYSRFKTVENVAEAKFELAEAVEASKGILVLNKGQISKEFLKKAPDAIIVGEGEAYYYEDLEQTGDGLSFTFVGNGQKSRLEVPLFGKHHVSNIVLATVMALKIGVPMNTIAARLRSLPQIEHRLEVKKQAGDITIIDDAYNSNIEGFSSALELLGTIGKGRKILMTPGMIEMGSLHDKLHEELGKKAAQVVDIALIIVPDRMQAFIKSFRANNFSGSKIIEMSSRAEAFSWLEKNLSSGDTLLIENDLLDNYESKVSL